MGLFSRTTISLRYYSMGETLKTLVNQLFTVLKLVLKVVFKKHRQYPTNLLIKKTGL